MGVLPQIGDRIPSICLDLENLGSGCFPVSLQESDEEKQETYGGIEE